MKNKTPEQELKDLTNELRRDFANHAHLKYYGGQDPFWPDGVNMNLTRNHIIYDKRNILEFCSANGLDIPGEYYIPTPAEVDSGYMATMQQTDRVKRLQQMGANLTTKKPDEYAAQTSFL